MALSVHRPAVATPLDSSELSVTDFFTEKLKTSNVVLVPPSFVLSVDPKRKLGEEAEKKVIDSMKKCGRNIPSNQNLTPGATIAAWLHMYDKTKIDSCHSKTKQNYFLSQHI